MNRNTVLLFALSLLILFPPQRVHGDDYSDCRSRCQEEIAACMGESQASDPTEQSAKEATCAERLNGCNANCEGLRPQSENTPPPTSPPPETPPEQAPAEPPPPGDAPPPGDTPPAPDSQPPPDPGGTR
jgi:hypothetical protein